jgi:hypothetical protein
MAANEGHAGRQNKPNGLRRGPTPARRMEGIGRSGPEFARTKPHSQRRRAWTARTISRSGRWKGFHQSEEPHGHYNAPGYRKPAKQSHDYAERRDRTDSRDDAGPWWQLPGRLNPETLGRSGGWDRGTTAQFPRQTGWPRSEKGRAYGSNGRAHVPSGLAAPVRVRPFPRFACRLNDAGREAGPPLGSEE